MSKSLVIARSSRSSIHSKSTQPRRTGIALALAAAFGAASGVTYAQNVLVPTGKTATQLQVNGNVTNITTGTIRGSTAINAFSRFEVDRNNTVNLVVPGNAQTLLNLVTDRAISVNGVVNSLKDGRVGGNVIFADPLGMMVSSSGSLNVGSLTVMTPSQRFMDGVISIDGSISDVAVNRLMNGGAERSAQGVIRIDGQINARERIRLDAATVNVQGVLSAGADAVQHAAFIGAVNADRLQTATGMVETNGVIEIVADGAATVGGKLDVARRQGAGSGGNISVMAGQIDLTSEARLDAAGTHGGGQINLGVAQDVNGATLHAGRVTVAAGAALNTDAIEAGNGGSVRVWGDRGNAFAGSISAKGGAASGNGGFVEVSAHNGLDFNGRVSTSAAHGSMGTLLLDPDNINIVNDTTTQAGENRVSTAVIEANKDTLISIKADRSLTLGGSDGSATTLHLTGKDNNNQTLSLEGDIVVFNANSSISTDGANVEVKGRSITLNAGSKITTVPAAQSGPGGNVTIAASSVDQRSGMGDRSADATVLLNGTIIANKLTLTADAKAESDSTGIADQLIKDATDPKGTIVGLLGFKWAEAHSHAQASVTVTGSANLSATGDLDISATSSQINKLDVRLGDGVNPRFNTVAVRGKIDGGAVAQVDSGAVLHTGGNLAVKAINTSELDVKAKVFSYSSAIGVTFAYADSSLDTTASIASGAQLTVAGGVDIIGRSNSIYSVQATSSAWDKGKAGIAAAISDLRETSNAKLDADVSATGNVRVQSETNVAKNFSKAQTETGSGIAAKNIDPALLIGANGGTDLLTTGTSLLMNRLVGSLKKADIASGGSGDNTTTLKVGAALSLMDGNFSADASIGAHAKVNSTASDVLVYANLEDHQIHNIAQSSVNSATKAADGTSSNPAAQFSGSAGVALAFLKHDASATVGQGANITAQRIAINSNVVQPVDITWDNWDSFGAIAQRISPRLGVPEQVLTSFANASAEATDGALAGSFNWFDATNGSRAWVDQSAQLTSQATLRDPMHSMALDGAPGATLTVPQSIMVRATNRIETVDVAGNISAKILGGTAGGGDAKAVGGAFNGVFYRNTTLAGIDDGAVIASLGDLTVQADSDSKAFVLAPSTGKGASISGNGAAAYMHLNNATKAALSNRADVTVGGVVGVNAAESLAIWSVAGAVNNGSNTSVGIGVAVNDVKTDTAALVGDLAVLRADRALANLVTDGSISTSALNVGAQADGQINALAVAGALASSSAPPSAGNEPERSSNQDTEKKTSWWEPAANVVVQGGKSVFGGLGKVLGRTQDPAGDSAGNAPAEPPQPKFGIAVAGSSSVNLSALDTSATIANSKKITAAIVNIDASNNTDLVAASGSAAIVRAGAPSVEASAAVSGALAINQEANHTHASAVGSVFNGAQKVGINAWSSGQHISMGLGVANNSQTDPDKAVSVAGSVSLTQTRNSTEADAIDSEFRASTNQASDIKVLAYDRTDLGIGGGSLAMGGATGVGLALNYGDIGNTVNAHLDGVQVTGANSVSVAALNPGRIMAGAAEIAQTDGKTAAGASVAVSVIRNTTHASIDAQRGSDGAVLKASSVSAGTIQVVATDSPVKEGLTGLLDEARRAFAVPAQAAGQNLFDFNRSVLVGQPSPDGSSIVSVVGGAQAGKSAYGAALSYNDIANHTTAVLTGTVDANQAGSTVKVRAADWSSVISVAFGLAMGSDGERTGVGSGTANILHGSTEARLGATDTPTVLTLGGQAATDDALSVTAHAGATVWSAAGSVAVSGKGNSVGAAIAYNEGKAGTSARIVNADVTASQGSVKVDAEHATALHTVAAAIAYSGEKDAVDGSFARNTVDDTIDASVAGSSIHAARLDVLSGDPDQRSATIDALAGSVAIGGKKDAAGVGVAQNLVHLKQTARVSDSTLEIGAAVNITALTQAKISALAAGVGGAKAYALGLSTTSNLIGNTTTAELTATSLNASAQTQAGTAALAISASDSSTINSLSGAAALSTDDGASIGAAISANRITNQVSADLYGGQHAASTPDLVRARNVTVQADSAETMRSIAIGVGASSGSGLAGGGSVSINQSGSTTSAQIDMNADVVATHNIGVIATNTNTLSAFAGGAGLSRGGVGVGLSTSVNILSDSTSAAIGGNDTSGRTATAVTALGADASDALTVNTGRLEHNVSLLGSLSDSASFTPANLGESTHQISGLAVNATSLESLSSSAVSLGAGKGGAGALTLATNLVNGSTNAEIKNAQVNQAAGPTSTAQAVDVRASTHAASASLVGTLALSQGASGGVGIDTEVMSGSTSARITDSTVTTAGTLAIDAQNSATIGSLTAGIAIGSQFGGAGTGIMVKLDGSTTAALVGKTAEAHDVAVHAHSDQSVNLIGGSIGGSAQVGLGAAFAVIDSRQTTRAYLGDADAPLDSNGVPLATLKNTALTAHGDVDVDATTSTDHAVYVASAGTAGTVGIGLTAGVVINENKTAASVVHVGVGSTSGLSTTGALRVHAAETDSDRQGAGALGVGVASTGMGATVAVTVVRTQVSAQVLDSTTSSASLSVTAGNQQTISSTAISVGAGLYVGVGGTVSLVQLGAADSGSGSGITGALGNVNALSSANNTGETGGALSDTDRAALADASRNNIDSEGLLKTGHRNSASAVISGSHVTTVSLGNVDVAATTTTSISNISGAGGAGIAGVGGAVAISSQYNSAEAGIGSGSVLDVAGALSVSADSANGASAEGIKTSAVAGAVGAVGLGAAVSLATINNEVLADVGGSVHVAKTARITASDGGSIDAHTTSVAAGAAAAVGLSYVEAEKSGNVRAGLNLASTAGAAQNGNIDAASLTIDASSQGRIKAETEVGTAGVGEALGGNHAYAADSVNVGALIGSNAGVNALTTRITATRTPQTWAKTYSVGVSGSVQVGVSESEAKVAGDTTAQVGDHVLFTGFSRASGSPLFGTLDIVARNLVSTDGKSADAQAFAAGGGLLVGANGAIALAENKAHVTAQLGNDVLLPMSDVSIDALGNSAQKALASGVSVGGLAGLGADVASATSDVNTLASLGSGAFSAGFVPATTGEAQVRGGNLTIRAQGRDDNQAQSTAGAGGMVAGAAAVAITSASGSANAQILGGPATRAAWMDAAGTLAVAPAAANSPPTLMTGALTLDATHEVNFVSKADATQGSVAGGSGANAQGTVDFSVAATIGDASRVHAGGDIAIGALNRVVEKDSGNNASGVSGGLVAGAGMSSTNRITTRSSASIGSDADVGVVGDPLADKVGQLTMTAGSIVAATDRSSVESGGAFVGLTSESSTTVNTTNQVTVGAGTQLASVGDMDLGTYAQARVENDAYGHGYGLAGGAGGKALSDVTVNQTVDVETGARLSTWGNLTIATGKAQAALHQNSLIAKADNQVYFDGAFNGTDPHGEANVHNNGALNIAAGATLDSVRDITLATIAGVTEVSAEGDGHYTLLGIPLKNHHASTSSDGTHQLTLNGTAQAGTHHAASLTIDALKHITESNTGGAVQLHDYDPVGALVIRISELTGLKSTTADVDTQGQIQGEIETLSALKDMLIGRGLAAGDRRDAVRVGNTLAAAGNIDIDTASFAGSGSLSAWGGPTITIANDSSNFLLLKQLFIPSELGGNIRFVGTGKPGAAFAANNVHQYNANVAGAISISNTYDTSMPGNSTFAPAIFLTDKLENSGGSLYVFNESGDFGQFAAITVNSMNVVVKNGAYLVNTPQDAWSVNGDPFTQFVSSDGSVYSLMPFTTWGVFNVTPQMGSATPGTALPGGPRPDNASQMYFDSGGGHGAPGSADEAVTYVANYFAQQQPGYTAANSASNEALGLFLAGSPSFQYNPHISGGTGWMFLNPGSAYTHGDVTSSQEYRKIYGNDTYYYDYRYALPAVGVRTLVNPIATLTPQYPANPGAKISVGTTALINANIININGTIEAGLKSDFSALIKPVTISAGIDASGHAITRDFIACIDDPSCRSYADADRRGNGLYKYPGTSAITAGDTLVDVYYDPAIKQLVLQNISGGGSGAISLRGQIVNTNSNAGGSNLRVSNGYAQVNLDNRTDVAVQTRDINTGNGNVGVITIADTLKGSDAHPLTTWYVNKLGEGTRTYESSTATDFAGLTPIASVADNSLKYNPRAGERYYWQYDADLSRTFTVGSDRKWPDSSATAWRWTPVSGPEGKDTPGNFWSRKVGLRNDPTLNDKAFQESISGKVTSKLFDHTKYDYNGKWDWYWNIVTGVHITATSSVKADYPINVSFLGGREAGGVTVKSNAPIVVGGNILNVSGTTSLSATGKGATISSTAKGSVQSQAVNLLADAGIGSLANPLKLTLTNPAGAAALQNKVSAVTRTGAIGLALSGADAVLSEVSTDANSDVLLHSYASMLGDASQAGAVVTGRNLDFISDNGSVGTIAAPLAIQAVPTLGANGALSGGLIDASAYGDIGLHQMSGDAYINHVKTTGDVKLVAEGSLRDGRSIDTADHSAQLADLWDKLHLLDTGNVDRTAITAYENGINAQYRNYWTLMRYGSVSANDVFVLAPSGVAALQAQADAVLGRKASQAEVQQYAQDRYDSLKTQLSPAGSLNLQSARDFWSLMGWGSADSAGMFTLSDAGRAAVQAQADASVNGTATAQQVAQYAQQRYTALAADATVPYTASTATIDAMNRGRHWTSDALLYEINAAALQPASNVVTSVTDTNISGRHVTLAANGTDKNIGAQGAPVTFDLSQGLTGSSLTASQKAALASANSAGDVINQVYQRGGSVDGSCSAAMADCKLVSFAIKQVNPLLIQAGTGLSATTTAGDIFLQAQGVLPVDSIAAVGNVALTAERGISNVGSRFDTAVSASGHLVLQNGSGSIGSATAPLTISVGGKLESARSGDANGGDIYLDVPRGDLRFTDLFAVNVLSLSTHDALTGNIIGTSMMGGRPVVSLGAQSLLLNAAGSVYQQGDASLSTSPLMVRLGSAAAPGDVSGVVHGHLDLFNEQALHVGDVGPLAVDGHAGVFTGSGDIVLNRLIGGSVSLTSASGRILGKQAPGRTDEQIYSTGKVTLNGGALDALTNTAGGGIGEDAEHRLLVAAQELDATTDHGGMYIGLVNNQLTGRTVRITAKTGSAIDLAAAVDFTATSISSAKGTGSGTASDTGGDILLSTSGTAVMTLGDVLAGRDLFLNTVDGGFGMAPQGKVNVTRDLHVAMTGSGVMSDAALSGGSSSASISAGRDIVMNAATLSFANLTANGGIDLTARTGDITYRNLSAKGGALSAQAAGDLRGLAGGTLTAHSDAALSANDIELANAAIGQDLVATVNGGTLGTVAGNSVTVARDLHLVSTGGLLHYANSADLIAGRDTVLQAAVLKLDGVTTVRDLHLDATAGGIDYARIGAGRDLVVNASDALDGGAGSMLQSGGDTRIRSASVSFDRITAGGMVDLVTSTGAVVGTGQLHGATVLLNAKTDATLHDVIVTGSADNALLAGQRLTLDHINSTASTTLQGRSDVALGSVSVGDSTHPGNLDVTSLSGKATYSNLNASGNLTLKVMQGISGTGNSKLAAGADARIEGDSLALATVTAGNHLTLTSTAGDIAATGTVSASSMDVRSKQSIDLRTVTTTGAATDTFDAGAAVKLGSLTSAQGVTVNAGSSIGMDVATIGAVSRLADLSLTAATGIDLGQGVVSGTLTTHSDALALGDVHVTDTTLTAAQQTLTGLAAAGDINVLGGARDVHFGRIMAGRDLIVDIGGALNGMGGDALGAGRDATLAANAITFTDLNTAGKATLIAAGGDIKSSGLAAVGSLGATSTVDTSFNTLVTRGTAANRIDVGGNATLGSVQAGSANSAADLAVTAMGALRVTSGDVWRDLTANAASIDLGQLNVHRNGVATAASSFHAADLTVGRQVNITAGTTLTIDHGDVGSDAALTAADMALGAFSVGGDVTLRANDLRYNRLSAGRDASITIAGPLFGTAGGVLSAARDVKVDATSFQFAQVTAGRDASAKVSGALAGDRMAAGGAIKLDVGTTATVGELDSGTSLELAASNAIQINSLAADTVLLSTPGNISVNHIARARTVSLAANTIKAGVTAAGAAPVRIDATGYQGDIASSLDLGITATGAVTFGRMYATNADIASTSRENAILDGRIRNLMRFDSATGPYQLSGYLPSYVAGQQTQLYEVALQPVSLYQSGNNFLTSAYVLQFARGVWADSSRYTNQHRASDVHGLNASALRDVSMLSPFTWLPNASGTQQLGIRKKPLLLDDVNLEAVNTTALSVTPEK